MSSYKNTYVQRYISYAASSITLTSLRRDSDWRTSSRCICIDYFQFYSPSRTNTHRHEDTFKLLFSRTESSHRERSIESKGNSTHSADERCDSIRVRTVQMDGIICVLNTRSILQKACGKVSDDGVSVPAYLSRRRWSAFLSLYTLHNDVYRRTDGNNRLESKYLTLFRAMFRLPKSAAYSGGLEARRRTTTRRREERSSSS